MLAHGYKTVMNKFRIEISLKFLTFKRQRTSLSIRIVEKKGLDSFKMVLRERNTV